MKRLLFRCDFGGIFGWGHLVRCASIAQAADACGYETGLVTCGDPSVLPEDVISFFGKVLRLDERYSELSVWESLLGGDSHWDIVVIDHYGYLPSHFDLLSSLLNKHSVCCVQVEDHPKHFSPVADIIVCPGFSGEGLDLGVFGPEKVYAGLDYVLLRPEFALSDEVSVIPRGAIPKVAVMLGGTDPSALLPRLLHALHEATQGMCIPEVILPAGMEADSLRERASGFFGFHVHAHMSSEAVVQCFSGCDYGITACGGTVYEMASIGLPFIGICVAENQERTAHYLEKTWSLPVISEDSFSETRFASVWASLMKQFPSGKTAYASIDTRGPYRTLSAMIRSIQAKRLHGQGSEVPRA